MKILSNLPAIDEVVKEFDIRNAICIDLGELIVFSGFAGLDLETGAVSRGDIVRHASDSLDCYEYILKSIGLSLDNVVKVNAYLKDPVADFPGWNETFKSRFNAPHPCRTTVGAPLVAGLIELEIQACRTPRQAMRPIPIV
jgi:2-iminobutanoate/2-iminopropanoate deaminase